MGKRPGLAIAIAILFMSTAAGAESTKLKGPRDAKLAELDKAVGEVAALVTNVQSKGACKGRGGFCPDRYTKMNDKITKLIEDLKKVSEDSAQAGWVISTWPTNRVSFASVLKSLARIKELQDTPDATAT